MGCFELFEIIIFILNPLLFIYNIHNMYNIHKDCLNGNDFFILWGVNCQPEFDVKNKRAQYILTIFDMKI